MVETVAPPEQSGADAVPLRARVTLNVLPETRVTVYSRDMGDTSGKEVCLALEGDITRERAEASIDAYTAQEASLSAPRLQHGAAARGARATSLSARCYAINCSASRGT